MKPLAIIESEFASAQLDKIYKNYPHFEHYWVRGITWILARNPEKGILVPDTDPPRYVIRFNKWNKGAIPALVIVYRYYEAEGKIELERVTIKLS